MPQNLKISLRNLLSNKSIMGQHIFEKEWRALGTDIYVQIVGSASWAAETEITFLAVQKLYAAQERIFSRFDAESELFFLNAHLGEFCEASVDMLAVAQKSVQYFEESGGLFDPRILDNL
ncbi:MAG: FAD:protein FMN transferase, partial [Parcubacteria group bacterium]